MDLFGADEIGQALCTWRDYHFNYLGQVSSQEREISSVGWVRDSCNQTRVGEGIQKVHHVESRSYGSLENMSMLIRELNKGTQYLLAFLNDAVPEIFAARREVFHREGGSFFDRLLRSEFIIVGNMLNSQNTDALSRRRRVRNCIRTSKGSMAGLT